ncbi:glutamine synthetase [Lentzea guizhouensis]|uniref:Glutamine synthetase n=1 Tax=Lentzea guizhouensis TaxID=1586287 RepID=A0A1B2HN93_9PSEU|nr:glutamine synthetase family protein [Lentzea guizhouensis]ANZ39180.1 glutamine synthetase [Lentzea guizhouensis]
MLTVEELREAVDTGEIDTVLVAIVDMQGRLQGKRCAARYFLDEVLGHSAEGCNYLMAVDVEMNPVSGFAMSSWERGYGDFVMKPDVDTLRRVPWQEGTALIMCDVVWENGEPVVASPRQVLRKQLDRLSELGLDAYVGTELEFIVFDDTYEQAWNAGYRNLTPSNQYNVDYSLLGTARVEPLLRAIRNGMTGAGMVVESAKGECNPGQHEIAFRYTTALRTCDQHAIYKNGAKEIASLQGKSLTFMAKYNEREGNSCHIHLSLRAKDGSPVFAEGDGMSELMQHFLAGQLAALREFTYFLAPNINSYKRFVEGSFAPTAVAWGRDNRTCALRVVGHGQSLRFENRVPGGDVNPYLAVAALIAAGLHGVEQKLALEDEFIGNAYASDRPTVPTTLREAADLLAASELAREAFGGEVVDHYLNAARVELKAFDAAVTDWEKIRGFERL